MKNVHLTIAVLVIGGMMSCKKDPAAPTAQILDFFPKKGSFNNYVTITGKNFDTTLATTTVTFNGVPATISGGITDSAIFVIVPANAATGKIQVTGRNGTATSTDDFIILPGTWTRKGDFPGSGRAIAAGFVVGPKGYLLGGADPGMTLNDLWAYEPLSDKWQRLPDPGFYLEKGVAVVLDGKAYVGVGYDRAQGQGGTTAWRRFDPSTLTWTSMKDFPGLPRDGAIGFALNGKAYVGLGWNRGGSGANLFDWYEYDPATDTWSQKATNPSPQTKSLYIPAGFVLNNKIYVGLGAYGMKNWWVWDPATDTWTAQADFPGDVSYGASGFVLNGKGYIAGGGPDCWVLDPATTIWKQMAFPASRNGGVAFTINNVAYYVTGSFTKEVWSFTP